jgi:EPS-associated MarR family transcriptional regulator
MGVLGERIHIARRQTNFCLRALLDKGLVKVQNFQNNKQKLAYAYLLTPAGIAEKSVLTKRFLTRKLEEYEMLKAEIELLRRESEQLKWESGQ